MGKEKTDKTKGNGKGKTEGREKRREEGFPHFKGSKTGAGCYLSLSSSTNETMRQTPLKPLKFLKNR